MADITIHWKDGKVEYREDHGAPGGSYAQTVKTKDNFYIITDAYGEEEIIHHSEIKKIECHNRRPLY